MASAATLLVIFTICVQVFEAAPPKIQNAEPSYRDDYTYIPSEKVFVKVNARPRTWAKARAYCEDEGAHLAVMQTAAEAQFVSELIKQIGHNFTGAWVGAHDIFLEDEFLTIFGDPLYDKKFFHEWAPNQPDNSGGIEDCVMLYTENGLLNDANCEHHLPFVCRRESDTIEANPQCENFDPEYQLGVQDSNTCFKLHLKARVWGEALLICYAEQSRLAIIDTPGEAHLYLTEFNKHPNDTLPRYFNTEYLLLGYHDIFMTGEYLRIDGKELEDPLNKDWPEDLPEHARKGDRDHCGGLNREGHLIAAPCNRKYMFVCERILTAPEEPALGLFSRFSDDTDRRR